MSLGMGGIEAGILVWGSSVVGVSVGPIDASTVAMRNPLDGPVLGLNVKGARSPHGHSAGIDSPFSTFRHEGFNQVAGPETPDGFGPRQVAAREALFGDPRSLIRTPAGRLDAKDRHRPGFEFLDATHTGGVQRMRFWNGEFDSVKLGQPSGERSDWQPGFTELAHQTFSGRINDRTCRQWFLDVR